MYTSNDPTSVSSYPISILRAFDNIDDIPIKHGILLKDNNSGNILSSPSPEAKYARVR